MKAPPQVLSGSKMIPKFLAALAQGINHSSKRKKPSKIDFRKFTKDLIKNSGSAIIKTSLATGELIWLQIQFLELFSLEKNMQVLLMEY